MDLSTSGPYPYYASDLLVSRKIAHSKPIPPPKMVEERRHPVIFSDTTIRAVWTTHRYKVTQTSSSAEQSSMIYISSAKRKRYGIGERERTSETSTTIIEMLIRRVVWSHDLLHPKLSTSTGEHSRYWKSTPDMYVSISLVYIHKSAEGSRRTHLSDISHHTLTLQLIQRRFFGLDGDFGQ